MIRASAPGRVNLIGEHTDYNGGFVLPAAIPQRTTVEMSLRSDDVVNVSSEELGAAEFRIGAESRDGDWVDYIKGCTVVLGESGFALGGFDLRLRSEVPIGSGLSSSAALEIALLRALRSAFSLRIDDFALAMLAHRAETTFVGAPVGAMDQLVSSLGRLGEALFIDMRSLEVKHLPLPAADLLVVWSGIRHDHATGDYRRRRTECEDAARLLGVTSLREVRDTSRLSSLPGTLMRRARHVITENARVEQAVSAIERGSLEELGSLLRQSHTSLRDDFEVSIPEIDLLVELANGMDGVYGARLTGGGFGGSIVALTVRGMAPLIGETLAARYSAPTGNSAGVLIAGELVCSPS